MCISQCVGFSPVASQTTPWAGHSLPDQLLLEERAGRVLVGVKYTLLVPSGSRHGKNRMDAQAEMRQYLFSSQVNSRLRMGTTERPLEPQGGPTPGALPEDPKPRRWVNGGGAEDKVSPPLVS